MSDSWIVNYAGRQRFQSQEIVKNILILTGSTKVEDKSFYFNDLSRVIEIWEQYHEQLKTGNLKDLGVHVENSDTIKLMFSEIDPYFREILSNVKYVRKYYFQNGNNALPNDSIKKSVSRMLALEMKFLVSMDKIVFQFDKEAKAKVASLKKVEVTLLIITLFILFLEGLFIFRPIVKQVRSTIEKLVVSEQSTLRSNEKLIELNHSLKIAEEELLKATREKYQQKIEAQKIRAASLIQGQEEERKRLSRELHDGLGQMLTALKLNVENVDIDSLSDGFKKVIIDQKELIKETIATTRNISFNLMPSALNDFGLGSALKVLAKQVTTHSKVNVIYSAEWNERRLERNIEMGLYRIAQEGVNNAMKYSQASQIIIHISANKEFITLGILDNGKGFNYRITKSSIKNGSATQGISNMKERVSLLDGTFKIVTKPGEGTKIFIKVPFKTNHEQNKSIISG